MGKSRLWLVVVLWIMIVLSSEETAAIGWLGVDLDGDCQTSQADLRFTVDGWHTADWTDLDGDGVTTVADIVRTSSTLNNNWPCISVADDDWGDRAEWLNTMGVTADAMAVALEQVIEGDFSQLDDQLAWQDTYITAQPLSRVLMLWGSPVWAHDAVIANKGLAWWQTNKHTPWDADDLHRLENLGYELATRYAGRVHYLQLWNELDYVKDDWDGLFAGPYRTSLYDLDKDGKIDAANYADMIAALAVGVEAAHGPDGPMKVVVARLAYDDFRFGPGCWWVAQNTAYIVAGQNCAPANRYSGLFDPYWLHNVLVRLRQLDALDLVKVVDVHHFWPAGEGMPNANDSLQWATLYHKIYGYVSWAGHWGVQRILDFHGVGEPIYISTEFGSPGSGVAQADQLEADYRASLGVRNIKFMQWFFISDRPDGKYGLLACTGGDIATCYESVNRFDSAWWSPRPSFYRLKNLIAQGVP